MEIVSILIAYVLGALVVVFNKGITININHNTPTNSGAQAEYNESLIDELDPEVRHYYERNNGLNKF